MSLSIYLWMYESYLLFNGSTDLHQIFCEGPLPPGLGIDGGDGFSFSKGGPPRGGEISKFAKIFVYQPISIKFGTK